MNFEDYIDKVRGCWVGKCLAGAIGMPFEGVPYPVAMDEENIYISEVPNDDLELQLVWLDALKQHGLKLNSTILADYWTNKIKHGCDEYSIALHNLKHGIMPPASGKVNNFFADGMGATIRSEIWALCFPERPDAAAYFAQQDAEVDHWGDGVRGEIFMAMAEAHACVHSDIEKALRFSWDALDNECRLYKTLGLVFADYDSGITATESTKRLMLNEQRTSNFTDCVMNLAFCVHSLLYGEGDFARTIMSVIAFGRDTDCTAATCGAFLGIAKGMAAIPDKWQHLVDDKLILSDFVSCIPGVPLTIDTLVEQTVTIHESLSAKLPNKEYPAYTPVACDDVINPACRSKWLILNDANCNIQAVKNEISATGKCPAALCHEIVEFDTWFMDLSRFAKNACNLHLISILEVDNHDVPEDEITISATADVGMRLWMDGKKLINHHSRQRMLPSFHRAEGGAAFLLPLKPGSRQLFHMELFNCLPPLSACIMFGNMQNDHLDGFKFDISC